METTILKVFWPKVVKTAGHHTQQVSRLLRSLWWDIARVPADRPIFVVGCSRAGTTLVYKTLSASRVVGTLSRETHDFWAEMHPLEERGWATHAVTKCEASPRDRARVTRYFYAQTGRSRWVDKNNQNCLCVAYLHALFPDAYFVYVKRNPGDNINSLIEGWGKDGKYSTWSINLPEQVTVDDGNYTRWCFFLAEGWREYISAPIEVVAAFQYRSANYSILTAKHDVPRNQWVEVFYEDLVRDPVGGFRGIFTACQLPFEKHMELHCQNVLKIPYDIFGEIRLDKWREGLNRQRVERVLPMVADTARKMGYPE